MKTYTYLDFDTPHWESLLVLVDSAIKECGLACRPGSVHEHFARLGLDDLRARVAGALDWQRGIDASVAEREAERQREQAAEREQVEQAIEGVQRGEPEPPPRLVTRDGVMEADEDQDEREREALYGDNDANERALEDADAAGVLDAAPPCDLCGSDTGHLPGCEGALL